MKPRVGIVCTTTRDVHVGRRVRLADNYLVCEEGRASWLEGEEERSQRMEGSGVLLAVADGEGDDLASARTASESFCRALSKRWAGPPPREPTIALIDFLNGAHTRMYWKSRDRDTQMGASCAVAWLLADRLHWVEVGTCRVFLLRDGHLRRLGVSWPPGETQRFLSGSHGLGDDTALHLVLGRNAGVERIQAGDQVIVATDGYWQAVDAASTAHLLGHVDDAQTAAVTMMERALSRGANDSVTVALADLRAAGAKAASLPKVAGVDAPEPKRAAPVRTDEPPVRPRKKLREATTEP
ncbi:MAG: hypothetical protein H6733_13510 [Alphaproteobacteria bacterium]|nr:hypothetical protein [Alphaproteobacteria bacterium]